MKKFIYLPSAGLEGNSMPLLVEASSRLEAKKGFRLLGLKDDPDFIDGNIEEVSEQPVNQNTNS